MSVSGERFMELSGIQELAISRHARSRIMEYTGLRLTPWEALELFLDGCQLKERDMLALGYRPAYGKRRRQGEQSWYFLLSLHGEELVAVLGQDHPENDIAWATTYSPGAQTKELRALTSERLVSAA